MKYVVQIELDPETGVLVESNPAEIEGFIGKWQALNPIGFYFALTRRAVTVIVDVPNEDAMFEALHATWVFTNSYPEVWPTASVEEFPAIMERLGIGQ